MSSRDPRQAFNLASKSGRGSQIPSVRVIPVVHRGHRMGTLREIRIDDVSDTAAIAQLARRRENVERRYGAASDLSEAAAVRWLERLSRFPTQELLFELLDEEGNSLGHVGASIQGSRTDLANLTSAQVHMRDNLAYRCLFVLANYLFRQQRQTVIGIKAISDDRQMRLFYRLGFELRQRQVPEAFVATRAERDLLEYNSLAQIRSRHVMKLELTDRRFFSLNDVFLTESRARSSRYVEDALADLPARSLN